MVLARPASRHTRRLSSSAARPHQAQPKVQGRGARNGARALSPLRLLPLSPRVDRALTATLTRPPIRQPLRRTCTGSSAGRQEANAPRAHAHHHTCVATSPHRYIVPCYVAIEQLTKLNRLLRAVFFGQLWCDSWSERGERPFPSVLAASIEAPATLPPRTDGLLVVLSRGERRRATSTVPPHVRRSERGPLLRRTARAQGCARKTHCGHARSAPEHSGGAAAAAAGAAAA